MDTENNYDIKISGNCNMTSLNHHDLNNVTYGDGRYKYGDIPLHQEEEPLGSGGYGEVYKLVPEDRTNNQIPPLAIKKFTRKRSSDPEIEFVNKIQKSLKLVI